MCCLPLLLVLRYCDPAGFDGMRWLLSFIFGILVPILLPVVFSTLAFGNDKFFFRLNSSLSFHFRLSRPNVHCAILPKMRMARNASPSIMRHLPLS